MVAVAVMLAFSMLAAPLAARLLMVEREPLRGDAIIVLSGSPVYAERLRHAVTVFQQGRAPTIVLTDDGLAGGWSRAKQRNRRSIERGHDLLLDAGVPGDRVARLPGRVRSTYDEALAFQTYARSQRIRSLVIVTSPYHARRALWTFDRVLAADGIAVGIDPVSPGDQSPRPGFWWLSGLGWQSVAAEYPKWVYYLIAYH